MKTFYIVDIDDTILDIKGFVENSFGLEIKAIKEKENGQKTTVSHKATEDELEAYFFSVIPNYDEDKVYPSDIKKIIQWYNILIDKGFLEEEAPVASQEAEA